MGGDPGSGDDLRPAGTGDDPQPGGTVLLQLPESERASFKDPLGPVFSDATELLAGAGDPIVAVGDVVTYHLLEAGRRPDVAVVDGITQRGPVEAAIRERVIEDEGDPDVENPPATLTADLLSALRAAIEAGEPRTVHVDGEEDLATLPAVLVAPDGASVVYGQPGEGMVLVTVTPDLRGRVAALFEKLDGDHDRARSVLGIDAD